MALPSSIATGAVSAILGNKLDQVFNGLLQVVCLVIEKNLVFGDTLSKLRDTLKKMEPKIRGIAKYDSEFDRPNDIQGLIDLMEEGIMLVKKCENIRSINIINKTIKKTKYTLRLENLQVRLANYVSFELQIQIAAVGRETLSTARQGTEAATKALSNAQQGAAAATKALEAAERHERVGAEILQKARRQEEVANLITDQMSKLQKIYKLMSARLTEMEKQMKELAERTTSKMPALSSGSVVLSANATSVSLDSDRSPPLRELEESPISIANNTESAVSGNKRNRSDTTSDPQTSLKRTKLEYTEER